MIGRFFSFLEADQPSFFQRQLPLSVQPLRRKESMISGLFPVKMLMVWRPILTERKRTWGKGHSLLMSDRASGTDGLFNHWFPRQELSSFFFLLSSSLMSALKSQRRRKKEKMTSCLGMWAINLLIFWEVSLDPPSADGQLDQEFRNFQQKMKEDYSGPHVHSLSFCYQSCRTGLFKSHNRKKGRTSHPNALNY